MKVVGVLTLAKRLGAVANDRERTGMNEIGIETALLILHGEALL